MSRLRAGNQLVPPVLLSPKQLFHSILNVRAAKPEVQPDTRLRCTIDHVGEVIAVIRVENRVAHAGSA
jgi:hypothetical protein